MQSFDSFFGFTRDSLWNQYLITFYPKSGHKFQLVVTYSMHKKIYWPSRPAKRQWHGIYWTYRRRILTAGFFRLTSFFSDYISHTDFKRVASTASSHRFNPSYSANSDPTRILFSTHRRLAFASSTSYSFPEFLNRYDDMFRLHEPRTSIKVRFQVNFFVHRSEQKLVEIQMIIHVL